MARISGVDIPNEKRIVISLQYIYGVGETTAKNILKAANVSEDIRTKDLTEDQLSAIRSQVAKYKVEGDLFVARELRQTLVLVRVQSVLLQTIRSNKEEMRYGTEESY